MRRVPDKWLLACTMAGALVAGLLGAMSARAQDPLQKPPEPAGPRGQDPVADLKNLLAQTGFDDASDDAVDFRKTKIQEYINRMKTPGQLRRALILDEWKVDPDRPASPPIQAVDISMRREIGSRLQKMLEKIAKTGDPTARLAVANMISEMGPTVRATDAGEKSGYTRSLFAIAARLAEDPDLGVRQEALRALGNINAVPKDVADVYKAVLQKDQAVGPRRLVADGLQQMIKVVSHLQKRGQTATGVEATRKNMLETLNAVVPVAALGVEDGDSEVRMLSLQAVQVSAQALAEMLEIPPERGRKFFPPPGRQLSVAERALIFERYKEAEADIAVARPMIDEFRRDMPIFAKGLRDPEPRVRLAAIRAFENLANARLRLVLRANSLPTVLDAKGNVERAPAELLKQADFLEPFLDRDLPQIIVLMRDPDVRIRRSATEMLEVLEDKAAPAVNGLVGALQDPDRFVKWTAARAIGFLPPDKVGPAVVPLAQLLGDGDINLRIVAAESLRKLGPAAKAAVPFLAQSIRGGDIEARLMAANALLAIGPDNLVPAIPALIQVLGDPDPRIVKSACLVIAEIGPPARAALPTLRRLIGHDDADVRAAASDAILSVTNPD